MKRLLTILSAAAIGTGALAQGEGLKFGAKAGLNITNLPSNESGYVSKSKLGLHLGGIANYGLGRNGNFSILAELLYSGQGAKYETVNASGGTETLPYSISYLSVPIQARYRLNFGLYFETGPYLAFLLGARVDGESEFDSVDGSGNAIKEKYKDYLNGTDFGWTYGLGYINEAGWGVGYRGFLGFTDISKDDDTEFEAATITLNTGNQLSFMWFFGWDD